MLLQQKSDRALMSADKATNSNRVGAGLALAPLSLQVGAYQDPGLRHKYRPNEDTVLIIHSALPSITLPPKPFVILAIADGMGGQEHGQEASQLAVRSLVEYMSGPLRSEQ